MDNKIWIESGEVWRMTEGEVEAKVPVTKGYLKLYGEERLEPELLSYSEGLIPPGALVGYWLKRMREVDSEIGGYLLRRSIPDCQGHRWGIMFPKQKASWSHWEAIDATDILNDLLMQGWDNVGTMHTHPGGSGDKSPAPSGIDTGEWEDNPGIHLIGWGGNEGPLVSMTLAVTGALFNIGNLVTKNGEDIGDDFFSEDSKLLQELIEKPVAVTRVYTGGKEGYMGRDVDRQVEIDLGAIYGDMDDNWFGQNTASFPKHERIDYNRLWLAESNVVAMAKELVLSRARAVSSTPSGGTRWTLGELMALRMLASAVRELEEVERKV